MRKWLFGIAGLLLGAGIASIAVSQVNVTAGLSGAEAIEMAQGGPGGPSIFTTSGRLSSGPAYAYLTSFPATFTIGANVGTVSTAGITSGGALNINAAAAGTTVYTFPPISQLVDGEEIGVCNITATTWAGTANTVAVNTGQSLVGSAAVTTLAASTCAQFQWVASAATWFRTTM